MIYIERFCCTSLLFFVLFFGIFWPLPSHAWRSYKSYVAASYGAQFGDSYYARSTNPEKNDSNLELKTGNDLTGYFGYSLGDYIVVEGFLDFMSSKSTSNYFSPETPLINMNTAAAATLTSATPTSFPKESFRTVTFGIDAYLALDGGGDFIPYIGAGAGLTQVSWGGFHSSTMSTELFFGGDLLLYPKLSIFFQLRFLRMGNLDFETVHITQKYDDKGNVITIKSNYRDSIDESNFVRADVGIRMPF